LTGARSKAAEFKSRPVHEVSVNTPVKALAVLGSPRQGGNSDLLLDAAVEGMMIAGASTEKVSLVALGIGPCTACEACQDGTWCVLEDDMARLYEKLEEADILVLASPVYFDSVTALMKAFIDRAQPFWYRKYVLKMAGRRRSAGFLAVGARVRTEFSCPEATVKAFFYTLDAMPCRTLGFAGFEERGSIQDHPTALQQARELGRALVEDYLERNGH
jgi:multimeric flavodoxin WrbA